VDSLRSALGERTFRFYEQVHSTQDLAREWAMADPDLPGGAVVNRGGAERRAGAAGPGVGCPAGQRDPVQHRGAPARAP